MRNWRLAGVALLFGLVIGLPGPAGASAQDAADRRAPAIERPAAIVVAAADAGGAVVDYAVPAATDAVDGPVPVVCAPPPGSQFPLGRTKVTCSTRDAAGNERRVTFSVRVVDQTPPVIAVPADLVVTAERSAGARAEFARPSATDNVDGTFAAGCDARSGQRFPVGATLVTCYASDAAGNAAAPVSFQVIVQPPVEATPAPTEATEEPTATVAPTEEPAPTPDETAESADTPAPEATAAPEETPTPAAATAPATARDDATDAANGPAPDQTITPVARDAAASSVAGTTKPVATVRKTAADSAPAPKPARAALELPWPRPGAFDIVIDGGPIDGLGLIWRDEEFPVSQEFGHTAFSVANWGWYWYGRDYGLDGFAHTGLDIGMPAGTWLYAPVKGTVKIAGGVPFYTFYGNGQPGVGELMIETEDGDVVILGHMGRIAVEVGDEVAAGDFVGLSGGENGDHLHLETRQRLATGWYRIIDPRKSFLIAAIAAAREDATSKER